MTGAVDPWEPPCMPALQWRQASAPVIERTPGPERTYDSDAADPNWKPRPVGFTAKLVTEEVEPQLWEGQD